MADNTLQWYWMVVIFGNLTAIFRDRPDVFIASNLLWYPVEGQPQIRLAPDVLVAFGRPRGHRGSYQQWLEGGVPLTVVFEIWSPNNTILEMDDKRLFYEEYGVEEYYLYDPDHNSLQVYLRRGDVLRRVRPVQGFVSPRLQIRFELESDTMKIYRPDGQPFSTFEELEAGREEAQRQTAQAQQQAAQAQQQAAQAGKRADLAEQRLARLTGLGRKVRQGQASVEELRELEELEQSVGGANADV